MIPSIISNDELAAALTELDSSIVVPSKTYQMDFDTGEILANFIDQDEAIRQAVVKSILTVRDKYAIYTSDYGCEIKYLFGRSFSLPYLKIEIPRLINEALMTDDRVSECKDFIITKTGDTVNVTFTVVSDMQSAIKVEVVI